MPVDDQEILGKTRQLKGYLLHQGALGVGEVFGGALQTRCGLVRLLGHRCPDCIACLRCDLFGEVVPAPEQPTSEFVHPGFDLDGEGEPTDDQSRRR